MESKSKPKFKTRIEEEKLFIDIQGKDAPTQIISLKNSHHSGMGKIVQLHWPYLFITEPYHTESGGRVHVYQWKEWRPRKFRFNLLKTWSRPLQYKEERQEEEKLWMRDLSLMHIGFGKSIYWCEPYLFIADCYHPLFQGSLFACHMEEDQPTLIYSHAITDENINSIIDVQKLPQIFVRGHQKKNGFMVRIGGHHRKSHGHIELNLYFTEINRQLRQVKDEVFVEAWKKSPNWLESKRERTLAKPVIEDE